MNDLCGEVDLVLETPELIEPIMKTPQASEQSFDCETNRVVDTFLLLNKLDCKDDDLMDTCEALFGKGIKTFKDIRDRTVSQVFSGIAVSDEQKASFQTAVRGFGVSLRH